MGFIGFIIVVVIVIIVEYGFEGVFFVFIFVGVF